MKKLSRTALHGAGLTTFVTMGAGIAHLAIVLPIIARIIPPEQFGLLGMAMSVLVFFLHFSDFGISAALVREEDPSDELWMSAFLMNLGFACVLAALVFVSAPLIGMFYANEQVVPIVRVLAFLVVIHGLLLAPFSLLQREMRFNTIAIIDASAFVIASVVVVSAALNGLGVWALVLQHLTLSVVKFCATLSVSRFPFAFTFNAGEIRRVLPFTLNLSGASMIGILNRNLDNILVGRYLGAEALGFYGRAYRIMTTPMQGITAGANFALYPVMAKLQQDRPYLREMYVKSQFIIATISFPIMIGLALVSSPLVDLILGPRWTPIVPLLSWLLLVGLIQSMLPFSHTVWKVVGKTSVLVRWSAIRFFGFTGAFVFGVSTSSLTNLVIAYFVVNAALLLPYLSQTCKEIEIEFSYLLRSFLPPAMSSLIMVAAVLLVRTAFDLPSGPAELFFVIPIGAAVYCGSFYLFFRSVSTELAVEARAFFSGSSANG